jgi:isopentenyl diphosphate isomerase/L-lactate dehydrogenase-like FMN-dependent dehydrogenase
MPKDEVTEKDVWMQVSAIQAAMSDIVRAIAAGDDAYLLRDLDEVSRRRNRLVNMLQTLNPELRIAAHEEPEPANAPAPIKVQFKPEPKGTSEWASGWNCAIRTVRAVADTQQWYLPEWIDKLLV